MEVRFPPPLEKRSPRRSLWPTGSRTAAITVSCLLVLAGCASWRTEDSESSSAQGLPAAKISPQASVIEVAFLPIPDEPVADDRRLPWDQMDESIIPAEIRRRLAANGLRAGRIVALDVTTLPTEEAVDESQKLLLDTSLASDFDRRRRRLTCREGQPYKLAVRRPISGPMSVLIKRDEGLVGRRVQDPHFHFGLKTFELDDGRIAARLVPEVQHGSVKQNYVASDAAAFRMDFSREVWTLDEFTIDIPLMEGHAIAIVPTEPPFGLGAQMLVGRRTDQSLEKIAVILYLSRRPER